jgi:uncharacterized membrane protein YkvA (DUF1232 family)
MSTAPNPSASPGLPSFRSILENAQLVWRLLQDDRVSTVLKVAIPLAVAIYFISPLDLIPDFIPVLGQLDDIGVILLGMTLLINMAPREVVNEHRLALGLGPIPGRDSGSSGPDKTTVIDGTYHTDKQS